MNPKKLPESAEGLAVRNGLRKVFTHFFGKGPPPLNKVNF